MTLHPGETMRDVLNRRLSRRRVLASSGGLAALSLAGDAVWAQAPASPLGFEPIVGTADDRVDVPPGYRSDVVLRWGDPLFSDTAALEPERVAEGVLFEAGAAAAQARQFGFNCDGIGLFPIDDDRMLMCVNHEFPIPALLFPGWSEARPTRSWGELMRRNPQAVAYMQASVGISVVELVRDGAWRFVIDSPYNRRITANTPVEMAGPAGRHPLLGDPGGDSPVTALGTLCNCAAGTTPWGTYLTAEENVDIFFGNRDAAGLTPDLERAYARLPPRPRDSLFRWEYADPRFDVAAHPHESLKFGWIVEIDPFTPDRPVRKRTALGRFKHEGATTVLAGDGRAVVYTGDDQEFEYLYKFVTAERFDPERPERNRDLLDSGTLYVARFLDDGGGEWLPLVFNEHAALTPEAGFDSQADVVLRCREAADRVGATPLDRPEDVAVSPVTGMVYLACTQGVNRGRADDVPGGRDIDRGTDAANPRAPNPWGHILELAESGADAAAETFRWEVFMLCGDPASGNLRTTPLAADQAPADTDVTYFGGSADADALSAIANPDNLGFDSAGNLWIVTDGTQPRNNNNGCFVCPTQGENRGDVRQFMSGPVGAEICGCKITADGRTLFLTVQHPGEGGSAVNSISRWPDGGNAAPRPSLVAIEPVDPDSKLGA